MVHTPRSGHEQTAAAGEPAHVRAGAGAVANDQLAQQLTGDPRVVDPVGGEPLGLQQDQRTTAKLL
ncbi:hypothetical protein [Promicromonospora soli]|uniref:hypothetical protein n=1 Tax=Promicromonospora soli TaxID=2035533 RepID=UPI001679DC59|nr:hypothetical protein [Promicromonospora soli]